MLLLEELHFFKFRSKVWIVLQKQLKLLVHLGTKMGRTPGQAFGYSQVANPIYLARKTYQGARFYPWRYAATRISRNLIANLYRSLRPEAYVDRRGRLKGNMIAFRDLLLGRLAPERALQLSKSKV